MPSRPTALDRVKPDGRPASPPPTIFTHAREVTCCRLTSPGPNAVGAATPSARTGYVAEYIRNHNLPVFVEYLVGTTAVSLEVNLRFIPPSAIALQGSDVNRSSLWRLTRPATQAAGLNHPRPPSTRRLIEGVVSPKSSTSSSIFKVILNTLRMKLTSGRLFHSAH